MRIERLFTVLILLTCWISAQAETVDCTPVTSLPAIITTQGLYCLTGNLATSQYSGAAVTINANNVTLDLNGWKLGGQGAGTGTTAYGIYSDAVNVTVKNGIVRGFRNGIWLNGRGATVQSITADQNTVGGIVVSGVGSVVQGNQVVDTGGSTTATNVPAVGIEADSGGSTVSNNVVAGLTATGNGNEYGIYNSGANSTVRDNVVSDTAKPTGGGASYGIFQSQSIAVNNTVSNFAIGINNNGGIYAHNTAYNCTTAYSGGTAGTGNSP